jgi:16S rRNA C967 or C1407 C5-methylase (RsmB/RsmF family)/NOL1/NOP2/fmu family ribosome biogenesis protein
MEIPPLFLERMRELLRPVSPQEYERFAAIYQEPPITGIRINTLKLSPDEFLNLSPFPLEPVPWAEDGFLVMADIRPGKHVFHTAGLYYVQEPSAMAAAWALRPAPGERVLDLCAAPGGKASHLAAHLQNPRPSPGPSPGFLLANETHPSRLLELGSNLERLGVRCAAITQETPARLAEKLGPVFDRVLVDAPCSGEGMFRKSENARKEWSTDLVQRCALRQDQILESAARLVRPGGLLVYSTCTFAPLENEGTVLRFLERQGGAGVTFQLEAPPPLPGWSSGQPAWAAAPPGWAGLRPAPPIDLGLTRRLWPQQAPGEGHFIACLRRGGADPEADEQPAEREGRRSRRLPRAESQDEAAALRLFEQFRAQCAQDALAPQALPGESQGRIVLAGSRLYWVPDKAVDLRGLHTLHPGWWLGSITQKRFIPSHALAMALNSMSGSEIRPYSQQHISLEPGDPRLAAYLRGEELSSAGKDGWLLVCVAGYPLGWGRRVQGRVKNELPKGLRQA